MPKIQFTRDADFSIDMKPVKYVKDEVYDLPQDQCDRWKKREAAVDYVPPVEAAIEAVKEALAPPETADDAAIKAARTSEKNSKK